MPGKSGLGHRAAGQSRAVGPVGAADLLLGEWVCLHLFSKYYGYDRVYVFGNFQHNLSMVASLCWHVFHKPLFDKRNPGRNTTDMKVHKLHPSLISFFILTTFHRIKFINFIQNCSTIQRISNCKQLQNGTLTKSSARINMIWGWLAFLVLPAAVNWEEDKIANSKTSIAADFTLPEPCLK